MNSIATTKGGTHVAHVTDQARGAPRLQTHRGVGGACRETVQRTGGQRERARGGGGGGFFGGPPPAPPRALCPPVLCTVSLHGLSARPTHPAVDLGSRCASRLVRHVRYVRAALGRRDRVHERDLGWCKRW